jgi:hypothetical protein
MQTSRAFRRLGLVVTRGEYKLWGAEAGSLELNSDFRTGGRATAVLISRIAGGHMMFRIVCIGNTNSTFSVILRVIQLRYLGFFKASRLT